MKLIVKSINLLLISARILLAKTEKVTFKVLAVNGTPTLAINYQQYPMEAVPDNYPLYKAVVDINEFPVNYNYIIDYGNGYAEQEEFNRQRSQGEKSLNEFFGRSVTIKEHPLLPKAYVDFPYLERSELFDDNFVATIIVTCDQNELNGIYSDTKSKAKINAEVVYASPYTIRTFKNASIGISGQSTRFVPKLSYKIKNLKDENKKELFGRSSIKLRAEHMDPSLLREKLYGDILNTLGVPTAQNTYARLYINGEPIGLFNLSDDIKSNRYLRNTFNNGKKYNENNPNPLFEANRSSSEGLYSDLGYYGDNSNQPEYSIYGYCGDDESLTNEQHIEQELIPLLREIDTYRSGASDKLSIDTDTFLKYMAMEFLGGGIDNYWVVPGNYLLFKDNERDKWYFHDNDFHYSFGCNWGKEAMLNTPLSEFPPYLEEENVEKNRPLLDAIRSRPENEIQFKRIFERLLKTSFHPNAIFPRLESLTNLIREDAHWDVSLKKQNPNPTHGLKSIYTSNDFENEATSEQEEGCNGSYPVRYFIKNKSKLTAQELGIEIPYEFENDLGFFENVSSDKDNNELSLQRSDSIKNYKWSIISIVLSFIIAIY